MAPQSDLMIVLAVLSVWLPMRYVSPLTRYSRRREHEVGVDDVVQALQEYSKYPES